MIVVAVVGRPNVGKSTLFNRIVGRRLAIVDSQPGVTRDRRAHDVVWCDLPIRLLDTAGLEIASASSLEGRMRAQTEAAISDADLCLFLIDVRAGVTPLDMHFAKLLHKSGKTTFLIANKCEGKAGASGLIDAFSLGFGSPIALSAEHGEGISDLYQALRLYIRDRESSVSADLVDHADGDKDQNDDDTHERSTGPLRVAIVGRPNVGKSTLINQLVGEERLLTGVEAGITRDAINISWVWRDKPVLLYDTAGIRRKAKVRERLEKVSVNGTLNAVKFAGIVVLLIDLEYSLEKQDLHIANMVIGEGRGLVIAVNKWDRVKGSSTTVLSDLRKKVALLLPQLRGVGTIPVSAKTGYGLNDLMSAVFSANEVWSRHIPTAALNRFLIDAVVCNPPPSVSGRRIRLRYMTQPKVCPPTFVVFSQRAEVLPVSYTRYLVNRLRETFNLPGVPIRLHIRKVDNPYVASQSK